MKIKRALVIDDETEICQLIQMILKKSGIHTSMVHTIKDLIDHHDPNNYDLVFMDINLPDGNGIDFIPFFRTNNRSAVIIVISAFDSSEEYNKAFLSGADYFLGKPFTRKEINNIIKNHN